MAVFGSLSANFYKMADLGKNVQLRNDQYLMTDSCKILTEKSQISRGYGEIGMALTGCFWLYLQNGSIRRSYEGLY